MLYLAFFNEHRIHRHCKSFKKCMFLYSLLFPVNLNQPNVLYSFPFKSQVPLQYKHVKSSKPVIREYCDQYTNWIEDDLISFYFKFCNYQRSTSQHLPRLQGNQGGYCHFCCVHCNFNSLAGMWTILRPMSQYPEGILIFSISNLNLLWQVASV